MALHVLIRGSRPLRQRLAHTWSRALPGPLLWVGIEPPPTLRRGDLFCPRDPLDPASLQKVLLDAGHLAGTLVLDDLDALMPHWRWFPTTLDAQVVAPVLGLAGPGIAAPRGLDLVADLDDDEVLVVEHAVHPSLRGLVIRQPGPDLLGFLPGAVRRQAAPAIAA